MPTTPGCQPSPPPRPAARQTALLGLLQGGGAHGVFNVALLGVELIQPLGKGCGLMWIIRRQQPRAQIRLADAPARMTRGPSRNPR